MELCKVLWITSIKIVRGLDWADWHGDWPSGLFQRPANFSPFCQYKIQSLDKLCSLNFLSIVYYFFKRRRVFSAIDRLFGLCILSSSYTAFCAFNDISLLFRLPLHFSPMLSFRNTISVSGLSFLLYNCLARSFARAFRDSCFFFVHVI